jgi:hypothetical protein
MRTLLNVLIAVAILIPVSASATHFDDVTFYGDCDGWLAEIGVTWRSTATGGEFTYLVELLDADENVLETQQATETLAIEPNPATYEFSGEWTAIGDPGDYAIRWSIMLVAPYDGGVDEEMLDGLTGFACGSVASESTSWTAIKSLW